MSDYVEYTLADGRTNRDTKEGLAQKVRDGIIDTPIYVREVA